MMVYYSGFAQMAKASIRNGNGTRAGGATKYDAHHKVLSQTYGALAGVISLVATARYLTDDPMEYNMKNVRNERKDRTAAGELDLRVDSIVGRLRQSNVKRVGVHCCDRE